MVKHQFIITVDADEALDPELIHLAIFGCLKPVAQDSKVHSVTVDHYCLSEQREYNPKEEHKWNLK